MKLFSILALSALLIGPAAAEPFPSVSIKACVQAKETNEAVIRQSADINMAGCVQAGRSNSVKIEQSGERNSARASQNQWRR